MAPRKNVRTGVRARRLDDAHGAKRARVLRVIAEYGKGGQRLKDVCAKVGIARSAFHEMVNQHADLQDLYARARVAADEVEFEALSEIADEVPPVDATGKHDSAWVAWQRTRIDTRKWMLAKKQPNKYGERQHVEHSGRVGLEQLVAGADDKPNGG